MLMTAIDESDSGDNVGAFVVSGFTAFSSGWADFSDEWEETVHAPPDIGFYKTHNLRSPAWQAEHGISAHQAETKTRFLAKIIENGGHLKFSVSMLINKRDFLDVIENSRIPKALRQPYQYCLHGIIRLALQRIQGEGICGDCVDFILDDNDGITRDAVSIFEGMKEGAPEHLRPMMGAVTPRDDKVFAPLQAADMLAGRYKDLCMNPRDRTIAKSFHQIALEDPATYRIEKPDLISFFDDPEISSIISKRDPPR
jgi:hypothetical protein